MATHFKTTGIEISGDHTTCKAWAAYNGYGTPGFQDEFGFASIADVSTGRCNLTFDNDPGTYHYGVGHSQGASAVFTNCINEDGNDGTSVVQSAIHRWDNNVAVDCAWQKIVVFTSDGP